jgi:hypothetical protein
LIPGLTLTAGTIYWLGLSNATGGAKWAWETTDGVGDHAQRDFGDWIAPPDDLAFYLTGTIAIPEPVSLALLGSSLLGFAIARRRKQAG